jgi:hypothetical protein
MNPWGDTSLEQRCLYSESYVNMCQQDHEFISIPSFLWLLVSGVAYWWWLMMVDDLFLESWFIMITHWYSWYVFGDNLSAQALIQDADDQPWGSYSQPYGVPWPLPWQVEPDLSYPCFLPSKTYLTIACAFSLSHLISHLFQTVDPSWPALTRLDPPWPAFKIFHLFSTFPITSKAPAGPVSSYANATRLDKVWKLQRSCLQSHPKSILTSAKICQKPSFMQRGSRPDKVHSKGKQKK